MKDRGFVRALIERAIAAKCSALVLTVDLQVLGQRHADIRNGLAVPPSLKLRTSQHGDQAALGLQRAYRQALDLRQPRRPCERHGGRQSLAEWTSHQFDERLNWNDVEWIRSIWPGKLIIKGILDIDDARLAAKTGAAAIVVSNHGGRQLDGAPSSISMLPQSPTPSAREIEILFDGGIRSGQDVMRALALGAKGCLIGRAYIFGLGAGGQAGVARAIEIIRKELDVTHGADRRQQHRGDRPPRADGLRRRSLPRRISRPSAATPSAGPRSSSTG